MTIISKISTVTAVATVLVATAASTASAGVFEDLFGRPAQRQAIQAPAYAPADEDTAGPTRADLRRQIVDYRTNEAPGTIIIDTPNTYLYLVMGNGKAMRYGIGVGREGFTWSGTQTITRKQ